MLLQIKILSLLLCVPLCESTIIENKASLLFRIFNHYIFVVIKVCHWNAMFAQNKKIMLENV